MIVTDFFLFELRQKLREFSNKLSDYPYCDGEEARLYNLLRSQTDILLSLVAHVAIKELGERAK